MNSRVHSITFCLAMLIFMLSGCVTVDQKINLTYKPLDRSSGRNSGDVLVSRSDAASQLRNAKGEWVVGSLNNIHGVRQADILSDRMIGEWISDALVQELKKAGYSAKYAAQLPPATVRGVVIDDINVFMNVIKGNVTSETRHELKFNVDIILGGLKIKTVTIAARDNKTLPLTVSQEEKERIMLQSLQDAMQQVIPELIVLFNKK
ncbi:MAG: hypothetical protein PHD54_13240 [Desulfuromonadaceae bacterium]|nr:hypothetical protein [Desulfuromonadaceae bacterium]